MPKCWYAIGSNACVNPNVPVHISHPDVTNMPNEKVIPTMGTFHLKGLGHTSFTYGSLQLLREGNFTQVRYL